MKKLPILSIIVVLFASCGTTTYTGSSSDYGGYDDYNTYNTYDNYDRYNMQSGHVSYDMFYNQLSPYGNWVSYPGYGRVWIVNEPGFRPYYSNGHWVYTNYGWTWASNYSWGWAPFHYGRWGHDPRYGWFWVPGLDWAPAWVSWRGNNSYYGWAPMAPNNWNRNHYDPWVFVNGQHMNRRNLSDYYVQNQQNQQLLNDTRVIRPERKGPFNPGPAKTDIERVTHEPITPVKVVDAPQPEKGTLSNNEFRIYRPEKTVLAPNAGVRPQQTDQVQPTTRPARERVFSNERYPARSPQQNEPLRPVTRPQQPRPTEQPRNAEPAPQFQQRRNPFEESNRGYQQPLPQRQPAPAQRSTDFREQNRQQPAVQRPARQADNSEASPQFRAVPQ